MRHAILSLMLLGAPLLAAQPGTPIVRSIAVKVVPTSPRGLPPVSLEDLAAAWKSQQVNLTVEKPLDAAALDRAGQIIGELYARHGRAVRVEHGVHSIPPRSVEVVFQVIEMCGRR